jgi:hypothetical protein
MVPAFRFLEFSREVKKVKYTGEILYNVLLVKYGTMLVNNLTCETLHPENIIAKLYTRNYSENSINNIVILMNNSIMKRNFQTYVKIFNQLNNSPFENQIKEPYQMVVRSQPGTVQKVGWIGNTGKLVQQKHYRKKTLPRYQRQLKYNK